MPNKPKPKKQPSGKAGQLKKRAVKKVIPAYQQLIESVVNASNINTAEVDRRLSELGAKINQVNDGAIQEVNALREKLRNSNLAHGRTFQKIATLHREMFAIQKGFDEINKALDEKLGKLLPSVQQHQDYHKQLESEMSKLRKQINDLHKAYGNFRKEKKRFYLIEHVHADKSYQPITSDLDRSNPPGGGSVVIGVDMGDPKGSKTVIVGSQNESRR